MDITLLISALSSALAIWLGGKIKASDLSNKYIPWITLAIAFLTQLVNALGVQPALAAAADSISSLPPTAPHPSFGALALSIVAKAIIQALVVTGGVSFGKNAILGQVSESRSYFRAFR